MLSNPDENHDTLSEYRSGRPADEDETGVPEDVKRLVGWCRGKEGEMPAELKMCYCGGKVCAHELQLANEHDPENAVIDVYIDADESGPAYRMYQVEAACGARGPLRGTRSAAVEGWNERPAVDALEAAARWVPVEEKMPDFTGTITFGGRPWPASRPVVGLGCFDVIQWVLIGPRPRWLTVAQENDGFGKYESVEVGSVTHWLPLPEPPTD